MKRLRTVVSILLILALIASNIYIERIPVEAAGLPHYEIASVPEYYMDSNREYYNFLASDAALSDELPLMPNSTNHVPALNDGGHPLNYRIWKQLGLVVYGSPASVQDRQVFNCGYEIHHPGDEQPTPYYDDGYFKVDLLKTKCGIHGTSCPSKVGSSVRGEWRFLGYDVSNNPIENIRFIMEHYTPFYGRMWIKEPWKESNQPKTNLKSISIYNQAVYRANKDSSPVRAWIDGTLKGWGKKWTDESIPGETVGVPYITDYKDTFNINAVKIDPDVYTYLYIDSAPTIMRSGQGTMWHQRPGQVYPKSLTVPVLTNKNHPLVECIVTTDPVEDVLESELDEIEYLNINVKGILHDEEVFTGTEEDIKVKQTIYYNRFDIAKWNFKITIFGSTITQNGINIKSPGTNQQSQEFIKVPVTKRQIKEGFLIYAEVQPVYSNNRLELPGKGDLYVKAGSVVPPEPEERVKVIIPTLDISNNIPNVAFDNIPFTGAVDNTDMSLVTSKELYVGGVPVDYDLFFSGNYVFPRTTDKNGYYTFVETVYHLDKEAILTEGISPEGRAEIESMVTLEFKSVNVVYVYPTKPYAHFTLFSNTWKENRIINVTNDSPSSNIQLIINQYPITQYRWYYGGDTTKLHYGTNTDLQKQLQYSEPGQYSLTLEAMNSLGQWSDPYTCEFTVLEDYEPSIECNLSDSVVTRQDTLSAWHYGITSTDGDSVASARIELWYDSDSNGAVDTRLQEWNGFGDNAICEKEDFPIYTPDKLGYYMYKIYANEEFVGVAGQDTLSSFVTAADKKMGYYEIEWWVDNYQPLSDIYIDAPIERPKVDLFIMLDKNLDDTKRETVINERVNFENYLLGQNIIPNVNIWDMKTYTYSQPANTSRNTGTSYPPASVSYESNGYSGTLNRTSVTDNGANYDYGSYVTTQSSQTFSRSWVNVCTTTFSKSTGKVISNTESNPGAPSSWSINENGYVGSIPRTTTTQDGPYRTDTSATYTIKNTWTANYAGTLTKSVTNWVPNYVWVSNYYGYYSGTIYKNVRQPYTDPYQGDSLKYILYLSDTTVNELADLTAARSKADSKLILAGQTGIQSQAAHDLYIDVTGKTTIEVVNEALDYIAQACPDIEQYYILSGQTFTLNMAEFDLEGDSIVDSELQYVHELNFFDNPTGQEPDTLTAFNPDLGWTDTVRNSFMNVGRYRIFRRVKDLPDGSNGGNYSYYSGATEVNIYVHRKPIADATLDWRYNATTGQCETVWVDKSYDLDHTSQPDKGIAERKIMFRRNGGEWQYYIPATLTYGTYDVQYYVRDIEGVWSEPWLKTFTLDGNPQLAAQARAKDPMFTLSAIPASESIEAYNIWTRQPSPVQLLVNLIPTVSGLPSTKTVSFQAGVTGTQSGQDINWVNQEIQIPQNFPDGAKTFNVQARDTNSGMITTVPFTVAVFTPINIVPGISGSALTCNEISAITAITSKYPSTTTVQMQFGTAYQSAVMNMTGTVSGYSKGWTVNYTIPGTVPNGTYAARFVSTNPSGKQEIKTCTYTVTQNRSPVVTITGTSPSFIYEGDDVSVNFTVNDPDLQPLNYEIRLSPGIPTVWTGTVSPSSGIYPAVSVPTVQNINPGTYTFQVTVTDSYGMSTTASRNITVSTLGIAGAVNHTTDWELNRQKYNVWACENGRPIRPADTFFAGEKYMLTGTTTAIDPSSPVTVQNVTVQIVGTGYSTVLSQSLSNIYTGSLWDSAMLSWTDRTVDFLFRVTYSNGTVKTDTVRTFIDNEEYWQLHRLF